MGALRAIVPEMMEQYFKFLARGTIAEGARLETESIPAEALCNDCSTTFKAPDLVFICPSCGSGNVELLKGMELIVADIEAE